jgi:hypothetical protein
MKKSMFTLGALTLVSLLAAGASANTNRTITFIGDYDSWNDTGVTPSGASLTAELESYGNGTPPFYSETGVDLNVTTGGGGNFNSSVSTVCSGSTTLRTRSNVAGNTAGDIHFVCPAFTVFNSATGTIHDL